MRSRRMGTPLLLRRTTILLLACPSSTVAPSDRREGTLTGGEAGRQAGNAMGRGARRPQVLEAEGDGGIGLSPKVGVSDMPLASGRETGSQ